MTRAILTEKKDAALTALRALCFFVTGACLLAAASAALAQLPNPTLSTVFPPGGKQGETFEVTIAGADLDDAAQLLFSHPGITARPKTEPMIDPKMPDRPVPNQFTVTIAKDVPAGRYEVRSVGRFGASNPRRFVVGVLPESLEPSGNNEPSKASPIAVDSIVNGRCDANAVDYYKLPLKRGERVIIDCRAMRIDSRSDATLVLWSPDGRELARERDTEFRDPLIDFTASADGDYLVGVYDFVFAGGPEYFYRLTVHRRPHIDFVFPPVGQPGSTGKYTVYGRNLPGGKPVESLKMDGVTLEELAVDIRLPDEAASLRELPAETVIEPHRAYLDGHAYSLNGPHGPSNGVLIGFATAPVVPEAESNDTWETAQKVTVPCEVVGQFYPGRDSDWVAFDARPGEEIFIEVIAHRMGLSCDPWMLIQKVKKNDKGEPVVTKIADVDDPAERQTKIGTVFDTSTDDPSYILRPDEEATYQVLVRDQFGNTRRDPQFVYRLVIRHRQPDFRLTALPTTPPPAQNNNQVAVVAPVVRKGGAAPVTVTALRRDGFDGEIAISVEGLPPHVSCPGAILGGGVDEATLVFYADEKASSWAGSVRIVGRATVGGKEIVRPARAASLVWGSQQGRRQSAEARLADDITLSVCEADAMPAMVMVGEEKIYETSVGANLEIPVKVARSGDFKDALKLTAVGLAATIKPKEVNISGNDGKLEMSITDPKSTGAHTFYLKADTKFSKYVRNPDAVKAAEEEKKAADQFAAEMANRLKEANAARDAAVKAAQDAAKKGQEAQQARQAANAIQDEAEKTKKIEEADKAVAEAEKAAKAAEEAKAAAEQAAKEADDLAKKAEQARQAADKRLADAKTANQPKDLNAQLVSTPIRLRVAPVPIQLSAKAPGPLKKEGKVELEVAVERQFGFADSVEVAVELPKGVSGLSTPKATLSKDQNQAKLELAADKAAPAGEHTLTIRAKLKFNNINLETTIEVPIRVE
jgi:hypothetical protein